MRTSRVPVLVVGAGPTGSLLTLELARRGVHVRTVDAAARAGSGSNAFILHARTLELLGRIDERLAARFLERGLRCRGYALHAAGGALQPTLDFSAIDSRYPFLLVHRQSETERYLREYAAAHFGVSPDWGTSCVAIADSGDGVVATLASDGAQEQVHCRFLVGCDGATSRVRGLAGLGEAASTSAAVDNLDVTLEGWPDDDEWVHYCAAGDDPLVVARLPGGLWRLQRASRPAVLPSDGTALARELGRWLAPHFPSVRLGEVEAYARWERSGELPPAYGRGHVFLAGDAAHGHSLVSGLDLDCALQDAANLGWKLAYVVKGLASPELLATYEVERRPLAAEVRATAEALQAALRGSASVPQLAERCAGLAADYRARSEPATAAPLPGPAVGAWAPDVELGRNRTLAAVIRQPLFTLLAMASTEEGRRPLEARLAPLGARLAALLAVRVVGPSEGLARRYGASDEDRVWLLRPDGYVAFKGLEADLPALEAWLAERFVV